VVPAVRVAGVGFDVLGTPRDGAAIGKFFVHCTGV
jgi:hypothetical protein